MGHLNLGQRIKSLLLVSSIGALTGIQFARPSAEAVPLSSDSCHFSAQDVAEKEQLRQSTVKGDGAGQIEYTNILKRHAQQLHDCRGQSWPANQAIWLRLYPCDAQEGKIDEVLDRIVNYGYNEIYLEVFYSGQVLLPKAYNSTVWDSILDSPGKENRDLLAETIKKAHLRGIKVYAWMFSLNYGYLYGQRVDRKSVLARNGKGENSLNFVSDQSQLFVDPYSQIVRSDYRELLKRILERKPDGVLFDYIRYPKGEANQSVVGDVKDLWIYGESSKAALLNRAKNYKGRFLLDRYINRGYLVPGDLQEADKLYTLEGSPLWEGRTPPANEMTQPLNVRYERIKDEIWYFTVAHAAQGVVDFLALAITQVKPYGIPAGAVFFPDGNQAVGVRGFDSRLQPWDHFPKTIEWHPMAYALCDNSECIVNQVKKVVSISANQTEVVPAIAGFWGKSYPNRPSLENQMAALRSSFPNLISISHFGFSWQQPEFDKERKLCRN